MLEVRMPQKGLTETSAYLSKWYVNVGDKVKTGDYLFAMETSKSVFDVEAEADGTVIAILYPEGDEVEIEKVVCVLGNAGEVYEGAADAAPVEAAAEPAVEEAPAPVVGEAPAVEAAAPKAEVQAVKTTAPAEGERVPISPRAKAKAEELGIDYRMIAPTGPEGRIIEEDVLRAYEAGEAVPAAQAEAEVPQAAAAFAAAVPCAAIAPGAQVLSAYSVETKIVSVDATELLAFESALQADPGKERTLKTKEDMLVYAIAKTAAKHPEMMKGMPVFFAGSGARYFMPALDPQAGWSIGIGAPARELAEGKDGASKEIRTIALSFVYDVAVFDRDTVDEVIEEIKVAIEHFEAFLALRA